LADFPKEFLEMLSRYPAFAGLPEALSGQPGIAMRFNNGKQGSNIADSMPLDGPVPWSVDGYYLKERPQFTLDPALHQGLYYVQDSSSMAVARAAQFAITQMGQTRLRVLDACAAPGGKTTAVAAVLPEGSAIVANEYDFSRAEILAENVAKWGQPVLVTRGDTARLRQLPDLFDLAVVDAPCSGEGMMRKDEKAVEQWTPRLVGQCAALQREILANVWETLRPGGFLMYSTCTFNPDENERNLAWIAENLGGEPIAIPALEQYPEITGAIEGNLPCYRFIPGLVRGEGLFLSLIRKPGSASQRPSTSSKQKKDGRKPAAPHEATEWLEGDWDFEMSENEIYALPRSTAPFLRSVMTQLSTLAPGIHVATLKGRDLIPAQPLALCPSLRRGTFPEAEITLDNALAYLRREAVSLPDSAPQGMILLTYRGVPLGFVKNLGRRSNNLYPRHWRIISR